MLFNSVGFLIFFPVVVLLYVIIPRRLRAFWLLVCSYFFYSCWNAKYALLIAAATLVSYAAGLVIDRAGEERKGVRRAALISAFVIDLGILFFFKYFNFTVESISRALALAGAAPLRASLNVLLPVGISFYTFQALGYVADVYRGEVPAEKNLLNYALFVSFFPQLVAGPIERSKNFLPQLHDIKNIKVRDYDRITSGLALMLWGFFQKIVLADRLAIVADTVFEEPAAYRSTALIAGMLAFTMQIYCDFGAYSNIAVGAARVMGFRLMDNFDTPYFAEGIADFWHRWHISMSSWFRDYVYIPLGGNRKGRVRRYVNIMLTFLASGLWHGANWTYVLWGAIHGALQVIGDLLGRPVRAVLTRLSVKTEAFSFRLLKIAGTFTLVSFAWIFFRAETMTDAFFYIGRIFTRPDPWALFDDSLYSLGLDRFEAHVLLAALVILVAVDLLRLLKKEELYAFLLRQNLYFRWGVLVLLAVMIVVYGVYGVDFDSSQFIYFTF